MDTKWLFASIDTDGYEIDARINRSALFRIDGSKFGCFETMVSGEHFASVNAQLDGFEESVYIDPSYSCGLPVRFEPIESGGFEASLRFAAPSDWLRPVRLTGSRIDSVPS